MSEVIVYGIVLSVMPIGEYDRRIELLTDKLGRISAFARGARRPGSQLVSVTRVFASGKFILFQGKNSYSVSSAAISNYFEELSADLDISYYGFYFLEMAQYFSKENMEAADMLKLLYQSLRALSRKTVSRTLVKCIYELKMLNINGICPTLDRITSGSGIYSYAANMSRSCRRAYSYVLDSSIEKLYTFILTDDVLKEFESITEHLVSQSVDRVFKSAALLNF